MARIGMLLAVTATVLALAGCQSSRFGAGSVAAYTGPGGGLTEGLVGNEIGRRLSSGERRTALEAEYRALEYGRTGGPIVWRGRRGVRGEVTSGPLYQVNERDCREYTHVIRYAGKTETARTTACRRPNGNWQPVG